jgi:hypothetical protein
MALLIALFTTLGSLRSLCAGTSVVAPQEATSGDSTPASTLTYQRTTLPTDVEDLYLESGDLEADTVLLVAPGGPMEKLEVYPIFDGHKDLHVVFVHQSQTLNPTIFGDRENFTFEDAVFENGLSVEILDRVVRHFRPKKKRVLLFGASFGTFLIQEYLAQRDNVLDAIGVAVGRLDIEEEMWQATREGRSMYFDDGKILDSGSKQNPVMGFLQSSLGQHRYTDRLLGLMENVIYYYATEDATIGPLQPEEIEFLDLEAAGLIIGEGLGHGDFSKPYEIRRVLDEMQRLAAENLSVGSRSVSR